MKAITAQDYQERIVRTLVYIEEHLDEELALQDLAGVAAFSSFHFHRIFRGLVGESLKEYVRRLRLERAARRLKQDDSPVTAIALEAGFDAHESFTRAFGEMFGVPPSSYRTTHRSGSDGLPSGPSGAHFGDLSRYHPPNYGDLPPVEIRQIPPVRVVFLRHTGPYDEVGGTWSRLMGWAGSRGLLGPGMKLIGIVHDDPDVTPAEKLRYDAAVTINRPVQPEGEIGAMEFAGGNYGVFTHRGPYSELGKAYQRLYGGWLPQGGRRLRDVPAFEQYLNSPQNTRPEDLLTVIHIPVD